MKEIVDKLDLLLTSVEELALSIDKIEDKLSRMENRIIYIENEGKSPVERKFALWLQS